jgi:hypothetical protein
MKFMRSLVILFCVPLLIVACSNSKKEYESLQLVQQSATATISNTYDYDIKIEACENTIQAIQKFTVNHKKGQWFQLASTDLKAWSDKKDTFVQEKAQTLNTLYKASEEAAKKAAGDYHHFCNIEELSIVTRNESKNGKYISISDNYAIRMRGTILGINIFKINVYIEANIDLESKDVTIVSSKVVE